MGLPEIAGGHVTIASVSGSPRCGKAARWTYAMRAAYPRGFSNLQSFSKEPPQAMNSTSLAEALGYAQANADLMRSRHNLLREADLANHWC